MGLLAACVRRGLKVLSATGAGARADPSRIRVADIRESSNDPLSRSVSPFNYSIMEFLNILHVYCVSNYVIYSYGFLVCISW